MPTQSRHRQVTSTVSYSQDLPSRAPARTSTSRHPSATTSHDDGPLRPPGREVALPIAVWLSGKEAAEYVGVSWPTLRQFILDNGVPYVRLGTRWKIERTVLDAALRRQAATAAAD
jgi:excisionase family DNA binding protein